MAPHSGTLAWKIPWTEEPVLVDDFRVMAHRAVSLSTLTAVIARDQTPALARSPGQLLPSRPSTKTPTCQSPDGSGQQNSGPRDGHVWIPRPVTGGLCDEGEPTADLGEILLAEEVLPHSCGRREGSARRGLEQEEGFVSFNLTGREWTVPPEPTHGSPPPPGCFNLLKAVASADGLELSEVARMHNGTGQIPRSREGCVGTASS
ncbi:hypothetical protein MG293_000121 [Ovis ammon polii]|uniref:Uncharacterized protein n=1 Tax=Ovis ammon polii TaxID=230172 RepID=A0AAD4UKN7_OVIAM|nr:hypothetical protein MG293_000121 [Ovis ammon polii]